MTGVNDLRGQVEAALNAIVDPCSVAAGVPGGLIDMGLARDLRIEASGDGAHVYVTLSPTDPMCMMAAVFLAEAQKRLTAIEGVSKVEIGLEHSRLWTPADMASGYRERLEQARTCGSASKSPHPIEVTKS